MEKNDISKLNHKLRNFCRCKLNIIFIICLSSTIALAQKKQVKGEVKNSKGNVVPYAGIVLKNNKDYIISFINCNSQGLYRIELPDTINLTSSFIEVNCIGYKKNQQLLLKGKYIYDFVLEEEAIDLKEVKIKQRPQIISIGDTLSYNVTSFSRAEDRSIGEVLKRLPGITVAENGQISYNGKAISNLFIHGDDLMDGRYGLATKVINKDMIKSIDVIQHFQPVNVLRNKVFTDDVAMNLVLKDENSLKLASQAMLGAGLPEQYDVALNTMMFNKKNKLLNSLKSNNSGIDMRNDFAQLGTSGFIGDAGNLKPSNILTLGTVGDPSLPKVSYYLNKSKLLNANNLINLNTDLQFKSNVQLFFDQNKLDYTNKLDNYLKADTIKYRETQQIINKPYVINTAVTATVNKNNYFLNNKLSFNIEGNKSISSLDFNNYSFDQNLKERTVNFFNDFGYIPSLKSSKNVIDIRWYIGYFNNPQQLNINAGLNSELFNEGFPYAASSQYLKTPTFFNNATIAYRIFNNHFIQQSYQLGMINERQRFNSNLNLIQVDNTIIDYRGDAGNDLVWQRDRIFANAEYSIKKESWRASLSLPLIGQSLRYNQADYGLNKNNNQFFLNPKANLTLNLNAEDSFALNYSFNNNLSSISNVYRGAVLANYRTIYANNADLQEQQTSNLGLIYNFKRSIIMLFAAVRLDYKKVMANTIASSELTANVQRTIFLPYQNNQNILNFNADISKYVFALNTTFSVNAVLSRSNYNQLINKQIYPFNNSALTLQGKIESKLFNVVTLSYNGAGFWNESKQKPIAGISFNINNKTKRFNQNLNIGYSPINNLFINLMGRHIYGSQSDITNINYFFMDVNTRYKLVKWRTDFELNISNLANIKSFEIFSLSSNQFSVSHYDIRGRMAIIRATFNL